MTSFNYKPRDLKTRSKTDVASELNWDEAEPVNKLKNKNSALLARYRNNNRKDEYISTNQSQKSLDKFSLNSSKIPKLKSTFRGVVFEENNEVEYINNNKLNHKKNEGSKSKQSSNQYARNNQSTSKRSFSTKNRNNNHRTNFKSNNKKNAPNS